MDPLSDVLRVTRLTSAVFFTSRLTAPWAVTSPPTRELGRILRLRTECISLFHVVAEGRFWISLDGGVPVEVEAGSIVVLPHGSAHEMTSRAGLDARPVAGLLARLPLDQVPHVEYGGGGAASRLVCGYLECEQRFTPLLGALPQLLLIQADGGMLTVGPAGAHRLARDGWGEGEGWLRAMLEHTVREANADRPGSPAMLARLTELLFVAVLRRYMEGLPPSGTGWLAAVRDRDVGRALQLLHREPERAWTVDALAREVHLSRSALAQRFTALVGEPPMHYLTTWRMLLARQLLQSRRMSTAQVARRVGYRSELGFHRAFKRIVGMPPAAWRSSRAGLVAPGKAPQI